MQLKKSIKQIAEEAGVSTATVSRVMNSPDKVTRQTRERVETVIEKYHYTPSLLAKGLRDNSMPIIGVMVPDIANEFFAKIVMHIQAFLYARGYWIIVCNSNKSVEMQNSYINMLFEQKIEGLILISRDSQSLKMPYQVPTVFVDRYPIDDSISRYAIVESNNYDGGHLATCALIEKGCKNIALISTSMLIHVYNDRMQGYRDALHAHGIAWNPELIKKIEYIDIMSGERAMQQLLDEGHAIDGVFACADALAVGAIRAIRRAGIRIPEEMKIVGYDDQTIAECTYPGITSIHQYTEQIAEKAVEAMIKLLTDSDENIIHVKLPVSLVKRGTTECIEY